MANYGEMYLMLFNSITDALGLLERNEITCATELLRQAQQLGEEMYTEK